MSAEPLAGRLAVVTGALGNLGPVWTAALAGAGARVVGLDVREGDGVVQADVTDRAGLERVLADVGAPTVLVNNAGIAHVAAVADMTTQQWDEVLGVNLRGAFFATRAVSPHMLDAGWGRVVNISSISAAGDPERIGYASAKAGLIGFTKTLALELGPHGVTANAIAPGLIVTDMTRRSAARHGADLDDYVREAVAAIPVRRAGRPQDIAHAASFLISREAGFVSGQVLYVAGGPVG